MTASTADGQWNNDKAFWLYDGEVGYIQPDPAFTTRDCAFLPIPLRPYFL